ncbi:MAG: hypothetical protein LC798_03105 [Chloroflexi bacterium]|nr:hypothetical protein [Chloroflexota bacterium]
MSWELDRGAIESLVALPEVAAHLSALATQAKAATERIAPRGPTLQYSRSIVVGPVEVKGKTVSTTYGSTDPAAHIVERGSVNNPPYMPLHRAAQALGLKVEK